MIRSNTKTRTSMGARMRSVVAGVLVALMLGSLAVPAFAGAATGQSTDPTAAQYGPPVVCPTCVHSDGGGAASASGSGLGGNVGPLPFTGFDVIAMAAVALAVTGVGLVLQRAVAQRPTEN
jgi:hypothetical protein